MLRGKMRPRIFQTRIHFSCIIKSRERARVVNITVRFPVIHATTVSIGKLKFNQLPGIEYIARVQMREFCDSIFN